MTLVSADPMGAGGPRVNSGMDFPLNTLEEVNESVVNIATQSNAGED